MEEPTATTRRRLWVVAVALVAGAAASYVAPGGWDEGTARLEVEIGGAVVGDDAVEVGTTDAIEITASSAGGTVSIALPNGVPADDLIEVEVTRDGVPLTVGDVSISLVLDDGRELIPVLSADDGVVRAARRPPVDASTVMALVAVVVVLWVSALVPLFVTSLAIPIVLAVAGVGSASEMLSPFFDPIIVLFFAGFVMAEVMRRVGLERWAALAIVARAGTGPVRLYAALLGVSAFLSMWMSNTASATVLIPIAIAVTEPFGHVGYRKAAVLAIAYAATIGGVGSAIGTPANQLAIRFVGEVTGRRISFVEWFAFGLPFVVIMLPILGWYLWWRSGVTIEADRFAEVRAQAIRQQAELGALTRDQVHVLAVFLGVVALWLSQSWHGVNTGIVALGGAVVLFATGRAETDDLGRISWPTLLTFGGGLALGVAMVQSGTADWIVTRLGGLQGAPRLVGIAAAAAVALGLSTIASNTASAATLIPLAFPLAGLIGTEPVALVVTIAIATSIDFALVIGTPPTMLAYDTGLYTPDELLRRGAPLDVVGLAVLIAIAMLVWPFAGLT